MEQPFKLTVADEGISMFKSTPPLRAVQSLCAVAVVLAGGCAAQAPKVAATQEDATGGDAQLTCVTEQKTGSLIQTRVCTTKAQRDRTVTDVQGAVAIGKGSASPR